MRTCPRLRNLILPPAALFLSLSSVTSQALQPPLSISPLDHQPHYTCEFPLLNNQSVFAELENTASTFIFDWESYRLHLAGEVIFPENLRKGMKLVNSRSFSGQLSLDTTVIIGRYSQEGTITEESSYTAPLPIPETTVPGSPGEMVIPVEGPSYQPMLPSDTAHLGVVTGDMRVLLKTVDINGEPAPAYGEVDTVCVQTTPSSQGITINPDHVDFGQVLSGYSRTEAVTVSNRGRDKLIQNIWLAGEAPHAFSLSHDCTILVDGDRCTIDVSYIPSSVGEHAASMTIDTPDQLTTVRLTGNSRTSPSPHLQVSPRALDFGTGMIGESISRDVTVVNRGSAAAELPDFEITGENASEFEASSDCGNQLAINEICTAQVTFTPVVTSAAEATLHISSQNTSESLQVPLSSDKALDPCSMMGAPAEAAVAGTITFSNNEHTSDTEGFFEFPSLCEDAPGLLYLMPFPVELPGLKTIFGSLQTQATVELNQTAPFSILSADSEKLQADVNVHIHVPEVTVRILGLDIKIGGGPECRTTNPLSVRTLIQRQPVKIDGTFNVGSLENCGLATSLLNNALGGAGHTISLHQAPE